MPATRDIDPIALLANVRTEITVPNMTPADDEVRFIIRLQDWPFQPDEGLNVIRIAIEYQDARGTDHAPPPVTIGADWGYGIDRATGLQRKDLPGGCPIDFGWADLKLRNRRTAPRIFIEPNRELQILSGTISTMRSVLIERVLNGRRS